MAMNCMKKLLLSGSAAPKMLGSCSGLWMILRTCMKKELPMVPCAGGTSNKRKETIIKDQQASHISPDIPGATSRAGQVMLVTFWHCCQHTSHFIITALDDSAACLRAGQCRLMCSACQWAGSSKMGEPATPHSTEHPHHTVRITLWPRRSCKIWS